MNEDSLPSYESYLEIQRGIGDVLSEYPNLHAYFDYFRAIKARDGYNKWLKGKQLSKEEMKSYFTSSINPVRGEELTSKQYQRLQQMYGSSTIKISMIDENLKRWLEKSGESEKILSTGGACALESIDTKRIIELSKTNPNLIKKYIEEIFLRFPTWTQITGALIPSKVSIFYDETFPWHLKISDYGIRNAELKTQRVYDRIFFTLQRFAKLHNPQNIVLRLPFISLNLAEEEKLKKWFDSYKYYIGEIESSYGFSKGHYDPDKNYKAWIEYTYFGPEILNIAKEKIKQQYPGVYKTNNLEASSIHVRGKQIDHFDVERLNLWMHKVWLGGAEGDKQIKKLLGNPIHREVIAMYSWARDSLKELDSIGSAGFLDFNYKGKLVHEDRLFTLKELRHLTPKLLMDELIDSPLRLHSRNLPDVLKLLQRFKNPYSVSFSKQIILSLTTLNNQLNKKEHKISTLKNFINYSDFFISLLDRLLKEKTVVINKSSSSIVRMLRFLIKRYKSDNMLIPIIKILNTDKQKNVNLLEKKFLNLIELIPIKGNKNTTNVKLKDLELASLFHRLLQKDNKEDIIRCQEYSTNSQELSNKIKVTTRNISENIVKYKADYLTNHVNILPLADNLFASYMQQFIFIPSIQNAYLDMIAIEKNDKFNKEEKEQEIVVIINKIYYVIEACLLYIFKNTSYPWEARFESRYDRHC